MGLFSGLEALGLGKLKNTDIYEEEHKKQKKGIAKKEIIQVTEENCVKENFPMCGMDQLTVYYLVADLARQLGNFQKAKRLYIFTAYIPRIQ